MVTSVSCLGQCHLRNVNVILQFLSLITLIRVSIWNYKVTLELQLSVVQFLYNPMFFKTCVFNIDYKIYFLQTQYMHQIKTHIKHSHIKYVNENTIKQQILCVN